jgi:glc operon protein GlcG
LEDWKIERLPKAFNRQSSIVNRQSTIHQSKGGTMPDPYGLPVGLDSAKKAAAAAIAEARRNNWLMAAAVVDTGGHLVYFEKMDGTQTGSVAVAISKARSAALFMRPTKAFQDLVAAGGDGLRMLGLEGAVPVDGGVPLVIDGKTVGAIGLSGGASSQDGQCARAGAERLKIED